MNNFIASPRTRLFVTLLIVGIVGMMLGNLSNYFDKSLSEEAILADRNFYKENLRLIQTVSFASWNISGSYDCAADSIGTKSRRGPIGKYYEKIKRIDNKWARANQGDIVNLEYYNKYLDKEECKKKGIDDPGDFGVVIATLAGSDQECEQHAVKVSRRYFQEFIKQYYRYRAERAPGPEVSGKCECN